ncbi:hypothetical protein [Ureibacillus sp. GCM10028918]|uniref:hypothetical protein n=1 Tax=Ureibacillus sp. GCM10028918 TaxID=3273429 RepID=UPI00360FC5EE
MNENKRDKIYIQKKVQGLYRELKHQRSEDMDHMNDYNDDMVDLNDTENSKIGRIFVEICVVLGILVLVLNALIKDF